MRSEGNGCIVEGEISSVEDDETSIGDYIEIDRYRSGESAGDEIGVETEIVALGDGELREARLTFELIHLLSFFFFVLRIVVFSLIRGILKIKDKNCSERGGEGSVLCHATREMMMITTRDSLFVRKLQVKSPLYTIGLLFYFSENDAGLFLVKTTSVKVSHTPRELPSSSFVTSCVWGLSNEYISRHTFLFRSESNCVFLSRSD